MISIVQPFVRLLKPKSGLLLLLGLWVPAGFCAWWWQNRMENKTCKHKRATISSLDRQVHWIATRKLIHNSCLLPRSHEKSAKSRMQPDSSLLLIIAVLIACLIGYAAATAPECLHGSECHVPAGEVSLLGAVLDLASTIVAVLLPIILISRFLPSKQDSLWTETPPTSPRHTQESQPTTPSDGEQQQSESKVSRAVIAWAASAQHHHAGARCFKRSLLNADSFTVHTHVLLRAGVCAGAPADPGQQRPAAASA